MLCRPLYPLLTPRAPFVEKVFCLWFYLRLALTLTLSTALSSDAVAMLLCVDVQWDRATVGGAAESSTPL